MESMITCDPNPVVNELNRVQNLAKQLETHLGRPSQIELCRLLAQEILSSIEKAISLAESNGLDGNRQPASPNAGGGSTDSLSGSPRSENSDRTFKDHEHKEISKKRKTQPKWTNQVRLGSGEGVEGPMDDGYSWRKYGQKDILGAKHPRGYFRCTHRNSQGCLAMKQVQRSDDNPSVFNITYRGTHTCHRRTSTTRDQEQKKIQHHHQDCHQQQHQHQNKHLLSSFQTDLKVKTEGLDSEGQDRASPSFSFPSRAIGSMMTENHIFSSSPTLDNCFMGSFSPTFISPTTSDSTYFSVSTCRMSSYGWGPNLQASESDLTETVSAATSATNSPMLDMDFMLEQVEFDPDFPFDTSSFFL